jgi:hypothetical protein
MRLFIHKIHSYLARLWWRLKRKPPKLRENGTKLIKNVEITSFSLVNEDQLVDKHCKIYKIHHND